MILQTHLLSKAFGQMNAVNNISLRVEEGEIYGFLGLNGAGKTTTIRMLLGMIRPTSGTLSLFGKNPLTESVEWNNVGYLVETPHAYPNLSVTENLEVIALLRKLKGKGFINDIIEKLHLGDYRNTPAKNLSLGNQQRLGLAKALIHSPKLLLLDEPINGLDPAGIVEVRNLLKSLAQNGSTIFLSSHILNEVSKIATRIGIIHKGRMISELNTHDLKHQLHRKLVIDTAHNEEALTLLTQAGHKVEYGPHNNLELTESSAIDAPEHIATLLVNGQLPPRKLFVQEEDLEAYFLRLISNSAIS